MADSFSSSLFDLVKDKFADSFKKEFGFIIPEDKEVRHRRLMRTNTSYRKNHLAEMEAQREAKRQQTKAEIEARRAQTRRENEDNREAKRQERERNLAIRKAKEAEEADQLKFYKDRALKIVADARKERDRVNGLQAQAANDDARARKAQEDRFKADATRKAKQEADRVQREEAEAHERALREVHTMSKEKGFNANRNRNVNEGRDYYSVMPNKFPDITKPPNIQEPANDEVSRNLDGVVGSLDQFYSDNKIKRTSLSTKKFDSVQQRIIALDKEMTYATKKLEKDGLARKHGGQPTDAAKKLRELRKEIDNLTKGVSKLDYKKRNDPDGFGASNRNDDYRVQTTFGPIPAPQASPTNHSSAESLTHIDSVSSRVGASSDQLLDPTKQSDESLHAAQGALMASTMGPIPRNQSMVPYSPQLVVIAQSLESLQKTGKRTNDILTSIDHTTKVEEKLLEEGGPTLHEGDGSGGGDDKESKGGKGWFKHLKEMFTKGGGKTKLAGGLLTAGAEGATSIGMMEMLAGLVSTPLEVAGGIGLAGAGYDWLSSRKQQRFETDARSTDSQMDKVYGKDFMDKARTNHLRKHFGHDVGERREREYESYTFGDNPADAARAYAKEEYDREIAEINAKKENAAQDLKRAKHQLAVFDEHPNNSARAQENRKRLQDKVAKAQQENDEYQKQVDALTKDQQDKAKQVVNVLPPKQLEEKKRDEDHKKSWDAINKIHDDYVDKLLGKGSATAEKPELAYSNKKLLDSLKGGNGSPPGATKEQPQSNALLDTFSAPKPAGPKEKEISASVNKDEIVNLMKADGADDIAARYESGQLSLIEALKEWRKFRKDNASSIGKAPSAAGMSPTDNQTQHSVINDGAPATLNSDEARLLGGGQAGATPGNSETAPATPDSGAGATINTLQSAIAKGEVDNDGNATSPGVAAKHPTLFNQPNSAGSGVPAGQSTTIAQNKQYFLDALNKGGITDDEHRAAMAAVAEGESHFTSKSETSYAHTSNDRIRQVFGKRLGQYSDDQLTALKSNPEQFFNAVYGGRLGNAADEGYKYRGRGYFQLTGKGNYERYGKMIGVDLVKNPDLANDPKIAAKIAVAYMNDRYDAAPGHSVYEKTARATGNAVASTEAIKQQAFQHNMASGEFGHDKVADLSFEHARIEPKPGTPGAIDANGNAVNNEEQARAAGGAGAATKPTGITTPIPGDVAVDLQAGNKPNINDYFNAQNSQAEATKSKPIDFMRANDTDGQSQAVATGKKIDWMTADALGTSSKIIPDQNRTDLASLQAIPQQPIETANFESTTPPLSPALVSASHEDAYHAKVESTGVNQSVEKTIIDKQKVAGEKSDMRRPMKPVAPPNERLRQLFTVQAPNGRAAGGSL